MKKSVIYLVILTLPQLVTRCYGQFLGGGAMGAALSTAGGVNGVETTALGMAGSYGPGYGVGPTAYGFGSTVAGQSLTSGMGTLGGCCNVQPGQSLSIPTYAHSGVPGYQSPSIYGPPHPNIMYNHGMDPLSLHQAHPMNFGSPYIPTIPPTLPHAPLNSAPMYPMGIASPGIGYNSGAMAMGYGATSAGGGSSGALALGSAPPMGYGQLLGMPTPPLGTPSMAVIAQPQQVNENENANTNININNDMGAHHSMIPKGLLGLTRV